MYSGSRYPGTTVPGVLHPGTCTWGPGYPGTRPGRRGMYRGFPSIGKRGTFAGEQPKCSRTKLTPPLN
eukprot:3498193-Rhodomonas_salina.1